MESYDKSTHRQEMELDWQKVCLTRTMGSGDGTGVTLRDYFGNHHYDMMVCQVFDQNRHNHRVVCSELFLFFIRI